MTKTFQEISEAIEATNLSPFVKDAFGFMTEAFAIDRTFPVTDENYRTEAEGVEAMTDQLYQDKANIISVIKAVTDLQTWVVVARLDGDETIILSREVQAASKNEAEAELIAELEDGNPTLKGAFDLEVTYGPF